MHASDSVAVVGMACRFPGADDVDAFWDLVREGRDTISRSPSSDRPSTGFVPAMGHLSSVKDFDADYFTMSPGEAASMDPQQRLLLEVAVEAIEDAGYGRGEANAAAPVVGVFVGGGDNEYVHQFAAPGTGRDPHQDIRLRTSNANDFLAARVAFKLGLTGPSITVQAGCATGLVAVATACNALLAGDCDLAIAGGVSLVMPDVEGYDYEPGGILSVDGYCRPFDVRANGTVPSSGIGLVVLRRNSDAEREGDTRRALLRGWAVNNDGGSRAGFTVPNVTGQAQVIRRAIERAGVAPDDIGYVETHGTATEVGDAVEIAALRMVFGESGGGPRKLGATKANIGHADAAAGIAGLIKSVLVVESGTIPPVAHFTAPNPGVDLEEGSFVVPTAVTRWAEPGTRLAGVSSFGLGGNNAHVIVGEAPAITRPEQPPAAQVIALSARSPEQLERLRETTHRWIRDKKPSSVCLSDAAFTLAVGRRVYAHRWAAVVHDAEDACEALSARWEAPQGTGRCELVVTASPAELGEVEKHEMALHPAYRYVRARLEDECGSPDAALGEVERAALVVLAIIGTLEGLHVTLARVDVPAWCRPALAWYDSEPSTRERLADVLRACAHVPQQTGSAPERLAGSGGPLSVGRVVVDHEFSLLTIVATLWAAGAPVDLAGLSQGEERRRIPLPTHPFQRREHWHPRSSRVTAAAPEPTPADGDQGTEDIEALVERIWCEVLGVGSIDRDAHFVDDLGGDSMYAVEIGGQINDELGLDLPIDLPFEAPTINDTVAAIRAQRADERTGS